MTTPRTNFIGINVSGTQARAALVNSEGAPVASRVAEVTPKELIPQLAAMVEELRGGQGAVGAIGVAIPIASSRHAICRQRWWPIFMVN
jgi:predicted NBD/HSP70 family sugar kinase